MKQLFHRGDKVRVDKSRGHTISGKGVIVGSYDDQYGRGSQGPGYPEYTIKFPKWGEVSWYSQSEIILISKAKTCTSCKQKIMNS